jgi:hypothetical protein
VFHRHHHIAFTRLSAASTGGETAMNASAHCNAVQAHAGRGSRLSLGAFMRGCGQWLHRQCITAMERPRQ